MRADTLPCRQVVMADCCLSGQKQCPCYEVCSARSGGEVVHVQRAAVHTVQSMWAVRHLPSVIGAAVDDYVGAAGTTQLGELSAGLADSVAFARLLEFVEFVFGNVEATFTRDSIFLQAAGAG